MLAAYWFKQRRVKQARSALRELPALPGMSARTAQLAPQDPAEQQVLLVLPELAVCKELSALQDHVAPRGR